MSKFVWTLVAMVGSVSVTYADTAASPAARDQSVWQTFMMIGLALVFFYFILWRPEQKRRKAMQKQRNEMKVGDRITAMGIVGTLAKVQDQSVIVKMYDGSKIEILKGAITDVQHVSEEAAKKVEKEETT